MNTPPIANRNLASPVAIELSQAVAERLPGVHVWGVQLAIETLSDATWDHELQLIHQQWMGKSRSEVLNAEKQKPYVEFMESIGLNAKKQPPSVANLITRCLTKETLRFPRIHPIVDAVNIAALQTEISLGVFDAACVEGNLQLSFSKGGESFLGLGADKTIALEAGQLVLKDQQKVLSIFSVRDSQAQAINEHTKTVWLLGCQVPGISRADTLNGLQQAMTNLKQIREKHD